MKHTVALLLFTVAACGTENSGADGAVADALQLADATTDAPMIPDAGQPVVDAFVDAPDLTCLGTPPSTAADPLIVQVTVFDASATPITALAGVDVQVRRHGDDQLLGQATSDEAGKINLSIATGGEPLPGYILLSSPGYINSRFVPTNGFHQDIDLALALVTSARLDDWYSQAGQSRQGDRGTVVAFTRDCNDASLEGTTISVGGATSVSYWNDKTELWDPQLTTALNSFGFATNVPTGATSISADYQGTALPARTVNVDPTQLLFVGIGPR